MLPVRHFLGWDGPVTEKLCDYLLPVETNGPIDLGALFIVVPTRQAGRRLREALARRCAKEHTGIMPPRVETPRFFLEPDIPEAQQARPSVELAAWVAVLLREDLGKYPGLWPAQAPEQDMAWALQTGAVFWQLRQTLVDGGYRVGDVLKKHGMELPEPERWENLARLEQVYVKRLGQLGMVDRGEAMMEAALSPECPARTERILLAAVPDPALVAVRAIEKLAKTVPVEVLVHAPPEMAGLFDEWGRPDPEAWQTERIDVPEADRNILLAGSPAAQGRRVVTLLAEEADRFGPADVAIGVPDPGVTRLLAAPLEEHGLRVFDPAGRPVSEHPVFHLLDAFRALVNERSYDAFSRLLRHPDLLHFFQQQGVSVAALLADADEFQNRFLPMAWADVVRRLPRHPPEDKPRPLVQAVALLRDLMEPFEQEGMAAAVRGLLQTVYEARAVNPVRPEGVAFRAVASLVRAALDECDDQVMRALHLTREQALDVFVWRLSEEQYYPEHPDTVIDLEGWLELTWNDAPFLVVTGMNEGFVPDGQLSDMFLPDAMRDRLGLRHDAHRVARDAFLLRGLVESRRADGRVCLVVGKTSARGDPLKPSRLLFRCRDEELAHRATRLFGEPEEVRESYPPQVSFKLQATPAPDGTTQVEKMHVTTFRNYLGCPFRFYLAHVLGMETMDDQKDELDALDFGILLHHAFQQMAEEDIMAGCTEAGPLAEFLWNDVQDQATHRFGAAMPLQVAIQLESARQRLQAAAKAQVALTLEGWETIASEVRFEGELQGMPVVGKIDRVDRHRDSGLLRILDYKTSDTAVNPANVHLGPVGAADDFATVRLKKRAKRWADLQLPLYRLLLAQQPEYAGPYELGYFNLPKAVNDTGVLVWSDFDDALLDSAEACASHIVQAIRDKAFWPPSERVRYDDFEDLFHGEPEECFDVTAFKEWMEAD